MSRRSSGKGSIVQRSDGRWHASLQVDGVRKTVYANTKREVQTKLRELQQQRERTGSLPATSGQTLNDLLTTWLSSANDLKPSTIARYQQFADMYVRDVIGSLRLDKLTPDRLQRFYGELPTPSVAERVYRILQRALNIAVMWGWLTENPCARTIKPVYVSEPKTLWSKAELAIFLDGTADDWLHPLWVFLLVTGCRLGEALALSWEDVHLDASTIVVRQTLDRIHGEWSVHSPKTRNAVRTLVLPSSGIVALTAQRQAQEGWQEAVGGQWEDWGLVFTGETGEPLFHSTPQHALSRHCKRLHVPKMTPHGFRHLHASLLLGEGVPITAVSARLGHASPDITLKVYAHALKGQDVRAAEAIGRVIGGPSGGKSKNSDE